MASLEIRIFIAVIFILVLIFSLIGSSMSLVTYIRRRKLHKPHLYLPVSLCIADIIAVSVWTLITIIALINEGWFLSYEICALQNYAMTFSNVNNMHTFLLLGVERAMKFLKPSKHEDVFIHYITLALIGAVWFMDGIIAIFPVIGWGRVRFYPEQYQCIPEYQLSTSHLNFLFVTTYVIPICLLVVLCILCFMKIRSARSKVVPDSGIITEEYHGSDVNPYSYGVKKNNLKFKNAGIKFKKPKLRPIKYTSQGYVSDSETDDESLEMEEVKRPFYLMSKTDYDLLKTYVIIICAYVLCWFPYVILSYTWTYSRYSYIPEWLILITVILTHITSCIKPISYYFFNNNLRSAFKKTISLSKCVKR
ncbi:melatonin receptor type 1A-like [Patella vulgata]|uniref:melatonin receptor type 1A-like n=1 Tax=Patella vulgata TaxID=6465 RepID=UPI00217FB9CF|nr:melatonin receptor type 1A-like [Patella vulgata]